MTEEETRLCTKCKREWLLNAQNFGLYVTGVFKRQCRLCERERTRAHYAADPRAKNAATVAYRQEHAEAFNAYKREWAKRNREIIQAYKAQQQA